MIDASEKSCKICDGPSPLVGVVDFHKSCLEFGQTYLTLAGIPIYYRRCRQCGFLFTTAFDDWSPQGFARHVYNADYIVVDPDYQRVRPEGNVGLVKRLLTNATRGVRILDFGGGNGTLAGLLRQSGYAAETYDPFTSDNGKPTTKFDVITCFEVFEHTPSPRDTLAEIVSLLHDGGLIIISTLLQPSQMGNRDLNWWYIAPRNGHISIHSRGSLTRLFDGFGFKLVGQADQNVHIAYASPPSFLSS